MSAEAILFLPGLFCDARLFTAQVTALSRETVVMMGSSASHERVEEMASDLLVKMPPKFAVLGHCVGGAVAMEILRRAPERVTRVALMSVQPLSETPQEAANREALIVAARAGRLEDAIAGEIGLQNLAPTTARNDVYARLTAMAKASGQDAYLRQARAMQRRKDQQATLRRIKQPALVICGEYDQITPVRRHEFMAELIPYAKMEIVPNAGHLPPMEQPGLVTDILRDWMRQPLVLR